MIQDLPSFQEQVKQTCRFLEGSGVPYLVIGGLASSILGEPRMTADLDLLLYGQNKDLSIFLKKARQAGFDVDEKKALADAESRLCFEMKLGSLHVDCLIAGTAFEFEALGRSRILKFQEIQLHLPSIEDFLLLKLIAGRDKDLVDAKTAAMRHKNTLDLGYMKKWAETFRLARPDSPVLERLKRLLEKTNIH